MSYRKRKLKRSQLNRWIFQIRPVWQWLVVNIRKLFLGRRRQVMRFPATVKVMAFLRERNRSVRANNLKISEWIDNYLDARMASGEAVTILTQWCVSKDLEARYQKQGERFTPTRKERRAFEMEIPKVNEAFSANGFKLNWWITFNRSYLNSGRIAPKLESEYKAMVSTLAEPLVAKGWLLLADWEDDILRARSQPNVEVLNDPARFVAPQALALEVKRHSLWAREDAGLNQSDDELRQDVDIQIACEAEEGRLLGSANSPFGEFILAPLEVPERYDFFMLLNPEFKKRVASVLSPYPWRLKDAV